MPAMGFSLSTKSEVMEFEGYITPYVVITCILAATGGLIFGYDTGISGGVTSMDDFLEKFFPAVYMRKKKPNHAEHTYCKYDDGKIQLFTSSLYMAGVIATLFASYTTKNFGRKPTILIAGLFFISGVALNAAAVNLLMLILGRILVGCGVGFANQVVPLFLSEIAPARIRGALNILFQLNTTLGILFANVVNYGAEKIKPWGWRLSLGLVGVPAVLLTVGSLFIVETPNSLVERGYLQEGRDVLRKIRGTNNVDPEFNELVRASRMAQQFKHPFRDLWKRRNRPQVVITICLQIFQQFTGINAIMFYAPLLFESLGLKDDASLYSAIITGVVNFFGTIISIFSVDRVGRKMLLIEAGVQMFITQVIIGVMLGEGFKQGEHPSRSTAIVIVVMVCTYVSAFSWSWGPLGWLIPSEIFPLETRSAGQSLTVCINFVFTFVIAQAFLSTLCHFKFGIFFFFAGWILIMTIFVFFLLPETKNVPIEEMTEKVWKQHWLWKKYVRDVGLGDDEGGDA